MNNFPIEHEGKTYWISRSVAVVGLVFLKFNNCWHVLANKRGKGCPNEVGKWCCPCGYLDYNEDGFQAVSREVYEETGINIPSEYFNPVEVKYSTHGNQNVSHIFVCVLNDNLPGLSLIPNALHCEKDEVDDIEWVDVEQFDVYKTNYDWAFGHELFIQKYFEKYCKK